VKELAILGGPNGAGKTTAAPFVLPLKLGIVEFINADEIARGLSPFNPGSAALAAGRLMLSRLHDLAAGEQNFAFETTCSGNGHIRFISRCKELGWRTTLAFLWLPSPEMAIERVTRRVAKGGHSIDFEVIVRRYWTGVSNMRRHYLPLVDVATIYDNSGDWPILVAQSNAETGISVVDADRWELIERAAPWPA
jgi:predicted ABC-type ATPase